MAVRVDQLVPYGYTDTAISTFHAFGDGLIREYALELGLPTDVRVLSRPEVVIFLREHLFEFDLDAYRPLGDPTRFLAALATLFSRCKDEDISPGGLPGPRRAGRGRGRPRGRGRRVGAGSRGRGADRDAADAAAEEARRQAELAAGLCHLPAADGGQRLHRLRRPGRAGAAPRADLGGGPDRRSPAASGTSSSTSSRTRTGPRRSSSRCSPSGHRNVTVVGDDDQAIYAFRGAAVDNILAFRERYAGGPDRRPAPELPIARAGPRRGLPADPVQRPGPARGPGRRRQAAAGRASLRRRPRRSGSRSSPRAPRRPTGSPPRSAGGSRPAPRRATTRCSSAPTATPTRSCGR